MLTRRRGGTCGGRLARLLRRSAAAATASVRAREPAAETRRATTPPRIGGPTGTPTAASKPGRRRRYRAAPEPQSHPSRRPAAADMNGSPITAGRGVLLRFIALYAALFGAFGLSSPFMPAFLVERGLGAEQLGVVLAATTAVRLVSGTVAGRLADRFHFLRAELALCAVLAAGAALLYLAAHGFWTIMAISLLQVVALAPLVPLADALSLAHARPRPDRQAFEYGWVRGAGSAAFVAGTLAAGQAASSYGLSAIIWLSAALLVVPFAAGLVPAFPAQAASPPAEIVHRPWLTLLRQRAFVCVVVVAALVLGSHA